MTSGQADKELEQRWKQVQQRVYRQFRKNPDINAILFLIGVRELGQVKQRFTKEEKQDLMHIAVCRLLSDLGYYRLAGLDQDSWPHWEAVKKLPKISAPEQERLLKELIIDYFEKL